MNEGNMNESFCSDSSTNLGIFIWQVAAPGRDTRHARKTDELSVITVLTEIIQVCLAMTKETDGRGIAASARNLRI